MIMDITRNQYFCAGLLLLLLGIEFRGVESFELNAELTKVLSEQSGRPVAAVASTAQTLTQAEKPLIKKLVRPPDWLGWSLMSIGAVLVLHSWGMKKPGS
jgi:hypothetical protein